MGSLAPAAAAAAVGFCALFFGNADAPPTWVGMVALLLAAVLVAEAPASLDRPAVLYLSCLFGLAVWCGLTMLWSISPDRTWTFTNRTLVYAAFALVGVVAGAAVGRERLAEGAAALLALVVGWALLAKCVPALYEDYGRLARLRAPVTYWNELALLCDAGVPLALWLAARARRVAGAVLLYGLVVTVLLTYSRYGVVLACVAAAAWTLLDRRRVESLGAIVLGGGAGAAVFGGALALPGITSDGQSHATRVHDGWIFALAVVAGGIVVAAGAAALARRPVAPEQRARIERIAALTALALVLAAVAVSVAYAHRIWSEFTNPVTKQLGNGSSHLTSASSSNRWRWWHEAAHTFARHPGGGTGAGTFELSDRLLHRSSVPVDEPHSMPLQFLSETGIVGLLLYAGVAAGALWGAWRVRREPAGLALGLAAAAFFAHNLVDKDWNYVASCGPLLLLAGGLVAPLPAPRMQRRPLLAVCCVAVSFAAIYSLAAPWLAQRTLATATTAAQAKRAHAYDPLSVEALQLWAAFEQSAGHVRRAQQLFRQAVDLEPENSDTWFALGAFYAEYGAWRLAYRALNNSYTYDRYGPAAERCGLLDEARTKIGSTPPGLKCPAAGRASTP